MIRRMTDFPADDEIFHHPVWYDEYAGSRICRKKRADFRAPGITNVQEVRMMAFNAQGMTWKEIAAELTGEFIAWGCRFDRKCLPEIAAGYDCTPLFFWNWIDDPETPRSEKGFLRVLGYAWRKHMQEEEAAPEAGRAGRGGSRKIAA